MQGEGVQRDHTDVAEKVPTETRPSPVVFVSDVRKVLIAAAVVLLQITKQHGSEPVGASGLRRSAPSR